MRAGFLVAALALCGPIGAQEVMPTALETFAADPDTRIARASTVGSMDSTDARLTVTALVLVNEGRHAGEMRGVRLALENNAGSDDVYLDARQLEGLRQDLDLLELGAAARDEGGVPQGGAPHGGAPHEDAPYNFQGTARCWHPETPVRILCPETYVTPDASGLSLRAFQSARFEFPNRSVDDLRELVTDSSKVLVEAQPVRQSQTRDD